MILGTLWNLSTCSAPRDPLLREEATVQVDGQRERWQLAWRSAPERECFQEVPVSCPCQGFAIAERGELDLVRLRAGGSREVLPLTPLFDGDGRAEPGALLQRWLPEDQDGTLSPWEEDAALGRRPNVTALRLADYDHDGRATEFVLQVAAFGCGMREAVLVGLQRDGRLGVYASLEHPGEPLVLEPDTWEALLRGPQIEREELGCGDHGSDESVVARVRALPEGLSEERVVHPCTQR